MTLIIEWIVSVFLCLKSMWVSEEKGDGNVNTSSYKQIEERKEDLK